jgi:hypothetical protein
MSGQLHFGAAEVGQPPARWPPLGMAKSPANKPKALVVGLAFDSDGHKRITTGKNFALLGGTEETHEAMTEKAVKINEKLAKRGKELHEISHEEFDQIAQEVGLKRSAPEEN